MHSLDSAVIKADDDVFFIAVTKPIGAVMRERQKLASSYQGIMITDRPYRHR